MDEPTKIYKDLDKLSKNVNQLIKPKMNLDKVKDITIFLVCLYLISAIFGYFENYLMHIFDKSLFLLVFLVMHFL